MKIISLYLLQTWDKIDSSYSRTLKDFSTEFYWMQTSPYHHNCHRDTKLKLQLKELQETSMLLHVQRWLQPTLHDLTLFFSAAFKDLESLNEILVGTFYSVKPIAFFSSIKNMFFFGSLSLCPPTAKRGDKVKHY